MGISKIVFKATVTMVMLIVMLCGCGGNNGKETAMDLNAYLSGSQDQQGENLIKVIRKP